MLRRFWRYVVTLTLRWLIARCVLMHRVIDMLVGGRLLRRLLMSGMVLGAERWGNCRGQPDRRYEKGEGIHS